MKQARVVVAYADMANAIGLIESLHGCTGLVKRTPCWSHAGIRFVGVKKPLWWIASLKRDEFERDGEMNEVKVEIIELQIRQRAIKGKRDMLRRVIGIPELRGYPKVFAGDEPIYDCPLDAVANLRLIAVVTSGVKMPVPAFIA